LTAKVIQKFKNSKTRWVRPVENISEIRKRNAENEKKRYICDDLGVETHNRPENGKEQKKEIVVADASSHVETEHLQGAV
jgi:hypothetical protein